MTAGNDRLTHLGSDGGARMVDVSRKEPTRRRAVAEGRIEAGAEAVGLALSGSAPKGDVAAVARIAAIQAAKKASELIPLCHPLRIDSVGVEVKADATGMIVRCTVEGIERTGFEMEAMTGAAAGLLAVYDMLKAVNRGMVIGPLRIVEKSGGSSGEYRCPE
jgi:cyclic pyranopterin phosphate synthase